MPGYDGTGPQGMGPMTGGARGMCNPAAAGYTVGYGWGRGMAYSRGARGGFGPGRGLRRGFRGGGAPAGDFPRYFGPPRCSEETELTMLKSQATAVKSTLDEINRRIDELEKKSE